MERDVPIVERVDLVKVQIELPRLVWRETKAKAARMGRNAQDVVAGCLVMVLDIDAPKGKDS